jgi:PEP-CTERM motif
MRRRVIAFDLTCLAVLLLCQHPAAGGNVLSPAQTQSTSPPGVLVSTDWGPGTPGITDPLVFNQFNPKLGKLTGIDITLSTTIRNDYILTFVATQTPTTIFVATSQTSNPSVLSNPTERAQLTDGPTITLYAANGVSEIFGPPGTRQPVDFVQMTESSGTWSSLLPITDPNYISPTMTQQSYSRTLTASNASSVFSEFIGTGTVDLPVTATAFSSFYSSTGNGSGGVLTKANASVTIQYNYSSIPEPSSVILLGLGIGMGLAARKLRGRASHRSEGDRN